MTARQRLKKAALDYYSEVVEREKLVAEFVAATGDLLDGATPIDETTAQVSAQKLARIQQMWKQLKGVA